VDEHLRELMMLREVINTIGRRQFESPLLRRLWSAEHGSGAAAELQRLVRLIDLLDAPRNQFFAPFGALLMWTPQVAFALERWRQRNGPSVRRWLESVGAFEALLSLAGFAYEHPDDAFPEVSDHSAMFEAHALAHPLLPQQSAIANHVSLSSQLQLLIVSGSNMSGKSTLLRSVGVNAVLAQAGSVVRAQHLRMSPLVIGASIRINDSLQEGSSRFYAEVTRVKTIVELASSGKPMLFLLDEIFNGTNSHDRRIGAEAVLKKLVATGAIGLVTTHDLALARLAEALPTARNVHFEDHLQNGVMAFDYRLKPGVVEKSNALELMRAVGLDV
jgi:DNA mismatch repair ATPase MutS